MEQSGEQNGDQMGDLTGRVAIVTGGATGIGRAIGIKMAEVGADIVVSDIDADACQRTATEIAAMGVRSVGIPANVTDPEAVSRMVSETISQFGKIDVLINNAGVAGAPGWFEHETSREEDWAFTFGVNVKGMAIVPCSMRTMGAVAHGYGDGFVGLFCCARQPHSLLLRRAEHGQIDIFWPRLHRLDSASCYWCGHVTANILLSRLALGL